MKAKALIVHPHDPKARAAEYLAVCSCWMCGNPRRIWKPSEALTVQERKCSDAWPLDPVRDVRDDD